MPAAGSTISDHDAHHVGRGVELAGLLAGGVGEVLDQPLVGGAEQVGELEVLARGGGSSRSWMKSARVSSSRVRWPILREVDCPARPARADLSSSRSRALFSPGRGQCDSSRMSPSGHEEGVVVALTTDAWPRPCRPRQDSAVDPPVAAPRRESLGQPLQEGASPEDVLLVLRRIHVAAQNTATKNAHFQLRQGQLHACTSSRVTRVSPPARSPSRRQKTSWSLR